MFSCFVPASRAVTLVWTQSTAARGFPVAWSVPGVFPVSSLSEAAGFFMRGRGAGSAAGGEGDCRAPAYSRTGASASAFFGRRERGSGVYVAAESVFAAALRERRLRLAGGKAGEDALSRG